MIEKSRLTVVWDKSAFKSLKKYCDYIRKDSPSNADLVLRGIMEQIKALPFYPLKFPPDKFKKDNGGHFRAFESYSLRVVYMITENQIIILRVRHVKQEPFEY